MATEFERGNDYCTGKGNPMENSDKAKEFNKTAASEIHPSPAEFNPVEIGADPILRFFHYAHLPAKLQERSKPFCDLARYVIDTTPRNAERTVTLRKLLEAKDCAIRAAL